MKEGKTKRAERRKQEQRLASSARAAHAIRNVLEDVPPDSILNAPLQAMLGKYEKKQSMKCDVCGQEKPDEELDRITSGRFGIVSIECKDRAKCEGSNNG